MLHGGRIKATASERTKTCARVVALGSQVTAILFVFITGNSASFLIYRAVDWIAKMFFLVMEFCIEM